MKATTNRHSGFTLLEVMIVVIILGMLAVIAIPGFMRARTHSQTEFCITNLKRIREAVDMYALDKKLPSTSSYVFTDISGGVDKQIKRTINGEKGLTCPAGGTYTEGATIDDDPTCSVAGHNL